MKLEDSKLLNIVQGNSMHLSPATDLGTVNDFTCTYYPSYNHGRVSIEVSNQSLKVKQYMTRSEFLQASSDRNEDNEPKAAM